MLLYLFESTDIRKQTFRSFDPFRFRGFVSFLETLHESSLPSHTAFPVQPEFLMETFVNASVKV